ncbi:MAG: DUF222 domain-containing protein [Dermatophilaceae bacterium]
MRLDQVRAADVAGLAASLFGLSDPELLAVDAETAEALVAAAQRVINAVSAVQAVAIEAWGRREGEQLSVDKAEWTAMAQARGLNTGGVNGARLRLLEGVPKDEHDFMPSYLAPVLRLSPRSAARRYATARTLVGPLPVTLAAMAAGDLEPHRAQQIVDEVPSNHPAVCAAVEAALFPRILDRLSSRVGMLARRAVAAVDPGAAKAKAEQAKAGRFVSAGPSGLPGLMRFEAELESGKGRQVWAAIEELAASYLKEEVAATMDQARADARWTWFWLTHPSPRWLIWRYQPASRPVQSGPARARVVGGVRSRVRELSRVARSPLHVPLPQPTSVPLLQPRIESGPVLALVFRRWRTWRPVPWWTPTKSTRSRTPPGRRAPARTATAIRPIAASGILPRARVCPLIMSGTAGTPMCSGC